MKARELVGRGVRQVPGVTMGGCELFLATDDAGQVVGLWLVPQRADLTVALRSIDTTLGIVAPRSAPRLQVVK